MQIHPFTPIHNQVQVFVSLGPIEYMNHVHALFQKQKTVLVRHDDFVLCVLFLIEYSSPLLCIDQFHDHRGIFHLVIARQLLKMLPNEKWDFHRLINGEFEEPGLLAHELYSLRGCVIIFMENYSVRVQERHSSDLLKHLLSCKVLDAIVWFDNLSQCLFNKHHPDKGLVGFAIQVL